jgi:hypothetical protein
MGKRITRDRPLTDEEAVRYQRIREQVAAELPDTMNTLMRYAQAVGKIILVQLEEDASV